MSEKYICPSCKEARSDFKISDDEAYVECQGCFNSSRPREFKRFVPDHGENRIDITPHGYADLEKAIALSKAHEAYESLVAKSHNYLVQLIEDLDDELLLDHFECDDMQIAERAFAHVKACRAAHNDLLIAVCGR
jgi:hypothetical protein